MRVHVQLFAIARDLVGDDTIEIELPDRPRVADLQQALSEACPALAGIWDRMRVAVNQDFAAADTPIGPDDEIALIPPVSGG